MEGISRNFDNTVARRAHAQLREPEPPYDLKRSYLAGVRLTGRGHMWALPRLPNRPGWQMSGGKRIG